MRYNMKQLYDNWDFEITGISDMENPVDNTLLLMKKADANKLSNLNNHKYCVVVAEEGIIPDKATALYNFFIFDKNPVGRFNELADKMSLS